MDAAAAGGPLVGKHPLSLKAGLRSKPDGQPLTGGAAVKAGNGGLGAGSREAATRPPFPLALALTAAGGPPPAKERLRRRRHYFFREGIVTRRAETACWLGPSSVGEQDRAPVARSATRQH